MQRVGVALRYPALGVINSLPEIVKFNFSRFGADFVTKTVKPGNAAVNLKNAAVKSQNEAVKSGIEAVKSGIEAVNLQNEAVKWHILLLAVGEGRSDPQR